MTETIIADGDRKVKIIKDKWGVELLITHNGYQWVGQRVDNELLKTIVKCMSSIEKNADICTYCNKEISKFSSTSTSGNGDKYHPECVEALRVIHKHLIYGDERWM